MASFRRDAWAEDDEEERDLLLAYQRAQFVSM